MTVEWQGTDPVVNGTQYSLYVSDTRSLNGQMPSAYVSGGVNSTATAIAETSLTIPGVGGSIGSLKAIAVDSNQPTPPTPIPFYSATTTKIEGGFYGPIRPQTTSHNFSFTASLRNNASLDQAEPANGAPYNGYLAAGMHNATAQASTFSCEVK